MSSLRSILEAIRPGDFLQSIDLSEAYLHVPVHPCHQRYLRFAFAGHHYQYRAMPFGLSSAPRTFTKTLGAVVARLHTVPIRLLAYLDDILIMSSSPDQAVAEGQRVVRTLQEHGFTINFQKSHLTPTTSILHLGAVIDTEAGLVFLSQDRRDSIVHLVRHVLLSKRVTLLTLSQLLGKMISSIDIVPWARRHARAFQWFLLTFKRRWTSNSKSRVQLVPHVRLSLRWWTSSALQKGCLFREPDRIRLTTDACLTSWGPHLHTGFVQGVRSPEEQKCSINFLELRAVRLALQHFRTELADRHVLVLTDNMAKKAHLYRQGGTRSRALMLEAERLFSWVERQVLSLTAQHL